MEAHAQYDRSLYTQLEFAYGPLLFYPTILLQKLLHCSWPAAYFLSLAAEQSVGLCMLAYVFNRLPMRGVDRQAGFLLMTFGALNPLLGLNYTFFRFLTPFASLLWATKASSPWKVALLLGVAEMLQMGISPEIGLAFMVASIAFAALRAFRAGPRWLLIAVAPVLGMCGFLMVFGNGYLHMLHSFSHGTLNLPVAPYPHILVYLFALVWLVPFSLGKSLGAKEPHDLQMAALYFLCIGLLPAAFGRCDPLHVFFNGAGVLILSLVAIRATSRNTRTAWLACLLLLVLWEHWVNNSLYQDRTEDVLRLAAMPHLSTIWRERLLVLVESYSPSAAERLRPGPEDSVYRLDVPALEKTVAKAEVATPLQVSTSVEKALKRTYHYRSDYYAFMIDVLTPSAEAAKIRDLNQAQWALLPEEADDFFIETPQNDGVQGFNFPYPLRHPVPYQLGSAFDKNLSEHWTRRQQLGPYVLYERRHSPSD